MSYWPKGCKTADQKIANKKLLENNMPPSTGSLSSEAFGRSFSQRAAVNGHFLGHGSAYHAEATWPPEISVKLPWGWPNTNATFEVSAYRATTRDQ